MKPSNIFSVLGASLTVLGSFQPWEGWGDFTVVVVRGIRVDFASFPFWLTGIQGFPVDDNGGGLVLLLTTILLFLTFSPPGNVRNRALWELIVSAGLMASALFFAGRWLFHRCSAGPFATIGIGLLGVLTGSAILLGMAIFNYRLAKTQPTGDAGRD